MPKVKICCIANVSEARLAMKYGADALGLVGPMPSGPGSISPEIAGHIVTELPSTVNTFYLTSKTTPDEIISEYKLVNSSHIQLTDATSASTRKAIKQKFPDLKIVQVIHVTDECSIHEALESSLNSDLLLLDSGAPDKAIKELGGTGRTHNWDISQQIVKNVNIPVFLAGGLKSSNVVEAINKVSPYGIDLCSGVRFSGRLNENMLNDFFANIP